MTKKPLDVGDEKQVKERKTELDLVREREIEEFRVILKTEAGRAFVWRALSYCKIMHRPATDPNGGFETFRQLGHGDIGQWLLNEVFTSDIGAFTLMMQEDQERKKDD